jgi:hypothetical protein
MPKIKSQADQRRHTTFRDQHGRKYSAVTEKETGDPVGAISPVDWAAPLLVPQKYLKAVPGEAGVLAIDYDEWIVDCVDAKQRYDDTARNYAVAMYGEQAAAVIENPTPELTQLVGPAPFPVELVQAAKAGNRWILGFADKVPGWVTSAFQKALEPADRRARAIATGTITDFYDEPDDDEVLAGTPGSRLDDQFDPDATGGKRVPVGKVGKGGGKTKTRHQEA